MLRFLPLLVVTLMELGCTHWVVIRSTPPGARAKVDGVEMGTTPFFLEDNVGLDRTYRIELEKEGYEPTKVTVERELQLRYACPSVLLCPCTLGLSLVGCAFSYALGDEYNFVLVPDDDSRRPPPAPPNGAPSTPDEGSPPADVPKKEDEKPVVPF